MQLPFTSYGLILGIAFVIGISLVERQMIKTEQTTKQVFSPATFYKVGIIAFIFGVFGARAWHVFTDFVLYKNNLIAALYIWNGGLSILGGVLGGIVGLIFSFYLFSDLKKLSLINKKNEIVKLLDYSIFGLPLAQAIGRWGNYFNQELYGAPTNGWFKIFIEKQNRFVGFENYQYYHPLFFYEMLATGLFALFLYLLWYKPLVIDKIFFNSNVFAKLKLSVFKIGTGNLFLSYVIYYSLVRFFLDFLRIDTAFLFMGLIGINQIFLLLITIILSYSFFIKVAKNQKVL